MDNIYLLPTSYLKYVIGTYSSVTDAASRIQLLPSKTDKIVLYALPKHWLASNNLLRHAVGKE